MALMRFFKMPKHQRYEYKPRYYNPQKEDLEERLNRIREAQNSDPESMKQRIAGSFRKGGGYTNTSKFRSSQTTRSNIILLGIIVFLVYLTYLVLSVYLPRILEMIEG